MVMMAGCAVEGVRERGVGICFLTKRKKGNNNNNTVLSRTCAGGRPVSAVPRTGKGALGSGSAAEFVAAVLAIRSKGLPVPAAAVLADGTLSAMGTSFTIGQRAMPPPPAARRNMSNVSPCCHVASSSSSPSFALLLLLLLLSPINSLQSRHAVSPSLSFGTDGGAPPPMSPHHRLLPGSGGVPGGASSSSTLTWTAAWPRWLAEGLMRGTSLETQGVERVAALWKPRVKGVQG